MPLIRARRSAFVSQFCQKGYYNMMTRPEEIRRLKSIFNRECLKRTRNLSFYSRRLDAERLRGCRLDAERPQSLPAGRRAPQSCWLDAGCPQSCRLDAECPQSCRLDAEPPSELPAGCRTTS